MRFQGEVTASITTGPVAYKYTLACMVLTYTSKVPLGICPSCGREFDAATSMGSIATPRPGSATVCLYCAAVLVFDGELKLRRITDDDLDDMPQETMLKLAALKECAIQRIINAANNHR